MGVLGIEPPAGEALATPEQLHLLETFAAQTALAIERVALVDEAQQARLRSETERLRNSLLSAVSHDLRTPLATITGSASALVEQEAELDAPARRELAQAIQEEADRLNRLVHNLLEMTRLESGGIRVRKDWHPLEEVVGSALARVEKHLGQRRVDIDLPPRSAAGAARSPARRAGAHQPARQRRQVHARGHPDRDLGLRRGPARSA